MLGTGNLNLLDNWYFPDPINQRGIVSGALFSTGYVLDRWMNFQANFAKWVSGEGLYFIGGNAGWQIVDQRMDIDTLPVGTTLTATMLYHDGDSQTLKLISVTEKWGTNSQSIRDNGFYILLEYNVPVGIASFRMANYEGSDKVVVAAKLEPGSRQTLARQDASGNWVLNDPPPNKALELAKCMRYQQVLNADAYGAHQFGVGIATTADQVRIPYQLPVRMANTPTASASGILRLNHNMNTASADAIEVTNLNIVGADIQAVVLRAYGAVTLGDWYALTTHSSDPGKIILDANL